MERKQLFIRFAALPVILAALLLSFGFVLYDLQVVNGADYAQQSVRKIAISEVVPASRGEILDSYGRVLVSNRTSYQVELDTSLMGEERNEILLQLIEVCREQGIEWTDSLSDSLSESAPFRYTVAQPFYSMGEDGKADLTRLGRVAEKNKWIQKKSDQSGAGEGGQSGDARSYDFPTAAELMDLMRESFDLDESLSDRDARALAGVLYELELRRREVVYSTYLFAEDVDIAFISRVKELGLKGVTIKTASVREYNTSYAAHILGRVGLMSPEEWEYYQTVDRDGDSKADYQMDDSVGKDGAEKAFEEYLRGAEGTRIIEQNTAGKIVSQTWQKETVPGGNVSLTIDIDLQAKVEEVLAAGIAKLSSKEVQGAAAAIVKVDDGSVLSLASYPTFDLANYSADYTENAQDPLKPLFNRALLGTYAPGSTFKMVTAIAGLEELGEDGKPIITPTTQIRDTGVYTYYGANGPRCWIYNQRRQTHGLQTVSQAIKNSCNVFFYDVGRRVGIQRLQDYAAKFGLGEKTGIELAEAEGVMAGPEYTESMGGTWYDGNTLSVAIGQESSQFTPIQLANYIATLVNGGTRYQVHLLKSVKSHDFSEVLYEYEPVVLDTIEIEKANLDAVKEGMLALTTEGSVAKYFSGLDVQVGAKTGSAQLNASSSSSNAVFVCFAPFDDPEIALALVVEKGGTGSELGAMAAEILEYYFSAADTQGSINPEGSLIR